MTFHLKDTFSLQLNALELGVLAALVRTEIGHKPSASMLLLPLDEKIKKLVEQIYTDEAQS